MLIGWGSSSKEISSLPDEPKQHVVTTFSYFHIAFLLRVTFARKWFLHEVEEIEDSEKVSFTSQPVSFKEVKNLLGKNPVNIFWWLFNQSLIVLIISSILFGLAVNLVQTGNPIKSQPKTVSQILTSKYWTSQEEKYVIETATDSEFELFLEKFRQERLATDALMNRVNYHTPNFSKDYQTFLGLLPESGKKSVSEYQFYQAAVNIVKKGKTEKNEPLLFVGNLAIPTEGTSTRIRLAVKIPHADIDLEAIYIPISGINSSIAN